MSQQAKIEANDDSCDSFDNYVDCVKPLRGKDSVTRTAIHLDPDGRQLCGKPKKRGIDRMKYVGVAPEDALDRAKWRRPSHTTGVAIEERATYPTAQL